MLKRPLNSRFAHKVLAGVKVCTIRDNPWPLGVPLMLYQWSGAPYRSKHRDLAVVKVHTIEQITISHLASGIVISGAIHLSTPLWKREGFDNPAEMDAWFSAKIPKGRAHRCHLMHFKLLRPA